MAQPATSDPIESTVVATMALATYTVVSAGQALANVPRSATRKASDPVTMKVTMTTDHTLREARPPTTMRSTPAAPVALIEIVRRRADPPKSAVPSRAMEPNAASTPAGVPGRSVSAMSRDTVVPIAARIARWRPTRPGSLMRSRTLRP